MHGEQNDLMENQEMKSNQVKYTVCQMVNISMAKNIYNNFKKEERRKRQNAWMR